MSDQQAAPPVAAISEHLVATLGQIAGLHFPTERLGAIAQRLRDLHVMAADLDGLDLESSEPAPRFDPSWPEGGEA